MILKTCASAAVALSWLSKKKSSEAIKTKRFATSGVRSHLHIIPSKSIYSLHESLRRKLDSSPLRRKKIQKHFAGIAFRQALAIQPDSLAEYNEAEDTGFIHGLLDADFKLYCGVFSVLQLHTWPEAISSDSSLMELSEALVDPNRPAYLDFENLLYFVDQEDPFSDHELFPEHQFWSITWNQKPDLDAAVFLSFLVMSGFSSKTPHLALAFAKTHSIPTILTQQLHITKDLWDTFDRGSTERYDFVGSIPEIMHSGQPGTQALLTSF